MDPEQVVSALLEHVLKPGTAIEGRRDWPDAVVFHTARFGFLARSAEWRLAGAPWVDTAVRVVADGYVENCAITYGFVFERGGRVLYLNDRATMRDLGRRVGDDLEPLAYAELVAELYSGSQIDGPTVIPFAATEAHPAGALIWDVDEFLAEYPFVAAALVWTPTVHSAQKQTTVEFCSYHYYITETVGALDILKWTIVGGHGNEVAWSRRYVAQRLERPA